MHKFIAVSATVLASLGVARIVADDPPPADPPAPNRAESHERGDSRPTPTADRRRETDGPERIRVETTVDTDAALRQTYDQLVRLRGERLDDRSKELVERATKLYRDAIEAYGADDEAHAKEARGSAAAARELTQTVQRLRDLQRSARPDPDLPPPPPIRVRARVMSKAAAGEALALPPPLPDGPDRPGAPDAPPRPPVPPVPPRPPVRAEARIEMSKERRPAEGDRPPIARRFAYGLSDEQVRAIESQIKAHAEKARELTEAQIAQSFRVAQMFMPGSAYHELQRARDHIVKAREDFKDNPDAKLYLDAARDLYNSARRDAEVGRMERALELARAAEALTHVPALTAPDREQDRKSDRDRRDAPRPGLEAGPLGRPGRVEERREAPKRERAPEANAPRQMEEFRGIPKREQAPDANAPRREEAKRRFEVRIRERAANAEHRPDGIEGIGVALRSEDGKVFVNGTAPNGPAQKDGRLKSGDEIVGIEREGGEKVEFNGKEFPAIVEALRGPAGSKVKLIVRPKGEEETKTYELTRARLDIPQGDDEDDDANEPAGPPRDGEGTRRSGLLIPGQPIPGTLPPPLPDDSE